MDSDRTAQFVHLLTSHQPRLYAYIATALLGDSAAADVLQDTNLHLWAHADRYDVQRPFLPWAIGYARQRVMAHRKTCSRSRLIFCDSVIDVLTDRCVNSEDAADRRLPALQKCLKRLNHSHAELIRQRYVAKTPVQVIADHMCESAHNISSRLHRIRRTLAHCVERTLQAEEV